MFLGVLLLILTTLSSFSSPALRAGPPDTTCDWTMEEILAPDWLLTWDTNSPVSAGENLSPALETTERPNPWGPRLEQARVLDNDELFFCFVNSPDFNVQSLHLKIVSFLLADFQDSVLRIYRQKLHELFLLLPFSPFSPRSQILVITRDICQAQDNVTEFYNQRSGNHDQGV